MYLSLSGNFKRIAMELLVTKNNGVNALVETVEIFPVSGITQINWPDSGGKLKWLQIPIAFSDFLKVYAAFKDSGQIPDFTNQNFKNIELFLSGKKSDLSSHFNLE